MKNEGFAAIQLYGWQDFGEWFAYCRQCNKTWNRYDDWINGDPDDVGCGMCNHGSHHEVVPPGCLWVSAREEELWTAKTTS